MLCLLALALSCGKDTITINGTIAEGETYPENTLVYLMDGDAVLDSAEVTDGVFTLEAPANPERYYSICADPAHKSYSWSFGIIAEAGSFPVTLSSDNQNCAIEGSPINQQYTEYRQGIKDIVNEY